MATHKEAALASVGQILKAAATPAGDEAEHGDGADVIATVCPMCQMNLDGYQGQALRAGGVGRPVTILYLSQLIGLAMGLPEDQTLMDKNLSSRTVSAPSSPIRRTSGSTTRHLKLTAPNLSEGGNHHVQGHRTRRHTFLDLRKRRGEGLHLRQPLRFQAVPAARLRHGAGLGAMEHLEASGTTARIKET
jgi:hypothetical protein